MSLITNRQIVLDTETTGMNQIGPHYKGHKIIEIGAVEVIGRRLTENNFHVYLQPNRLIDPEAFKIHGITNDFLLGKPIFANIAEEFIEYIRGAELVIHNASFDIGFINYELKKLNRNILQIDEICRITDSLVLARKIFPGKRNSLDALCSRYKICNTNRALHSALLDAKLLARVYLCMTGGQTSMTFNEENDIRKTIKNVCTKKIEYRKTGRLRVILASNKELADHKSRLDLIQRKSGVCLWKE